MNKKRKIELLAPAKNLECGLAAIEHGADAIYIGAPNFGARSSAGNSVEDITLLCSRAHLFGVKIYITLNTILSDTELLEAEILIWKLWEKAKIDALIIQDLGITKLNLPPIPLHASTQMDNRGTDKVKFLQDIGFEQIVLPREMTLVEIKNISTNIDIPLEFFVHGAICVSYSGQCFISQAISKRSANKGKCAQYCRLPYTLRDTFKKVIIDSKHLLSMKDMNLSNDLEKLIDAGISSLKIEGRMKDVTYVKNTVSFYRKKIDDIIIRRNEYERSSIGSSSITFQADLNKSFNRSFSTYYLNGRNEETKELWTLNSPKSVGQSLGVVDKCWKNKISIKTDDVIVAGDGLCFFDENKELKGLNVNSVDNNIVVTDLMIPQNTAIFRNRNHKFEAEVNRNNSAKRSLNIDIKLCDINNGFELSIYQPEVNLSLTKKYISNKELAKSNQSDRMKDTLSKTGDTIFKVQNIAIELSDNFFIPLSLLSDWRRQIIEEFTKLVSISYDNNKYKKEFIQTDIPYPCTEIDYKGNVMNTKALEFYKQHKCKVTEKAFEITSKENVPLMFTKHCIKYALGMCHKNRLKNIDNIYTEPFELVYKDIILKLEFDCKRCEMKILK